MTEDADLGMRMARAGLRCEMISPPTSEDAPKRFKVWRAQRTRWIKGYLQTWLVLMRAPRKAMRQIGFIPFLSMQLSLGGAIIAPILYAPCFVLLLLIVLVPQWTVPYLGLVLLFAAWITNLLADLCAPGAMTWRRLVAAFTRPIYWSLHSLAAYCAIWELAKAPFFWAKTPHQPRTVEETETCSTGSSASAWPSPSSPLAYSHMGNSAPSASLISDPTNGHGG